MENKRVLFITFDMSGYYSSVLEELRARYSEVDFYNTATMSYKYKNVFEKIYSFFYKAFTGQKLKNFYKYQGVIEEVKGNEYDVILVVRPDLFFDSQLTVLRKSTPFFVAYYHDSVNNFKRKSQITHFFDKVYSYEKRDVERYNLEFLPNFIYFPKGKSKDVIEYDAFSVMSKDYRLKTLRNVAVSLKEKAITYNFYVMDKKEENDGLISFFTKRMNNEMVVSHIRKSRIIVDVHKYGIQDGLTFRVFEALGYDKKLITTNTSIKEYDFYDPNNIFIIENVDDVWIPELFLTSEYKPIPTEIYEKYTVQSWLTNILKH